jgi:hypothetical protein
MKKPLLLALFATGACCALAVSANHSEAHIEDASKSCNTECLLNQIDMLDKKVDALERTVDALSIQTSKSIKSGQKIILHTDPGTAGGGCLTYIGPSGDLGGFVSWNANCSHHQTCRVEPRQRCLTIFDALIAIDPSPLRSH